jgi:hydroxyethylthiazole kinase-like uncharacterized protein yjeF
LITFKDVMVLDMNSEYHNTPKLTLMENAGRGVFEVMSQAYDLKGKHVVFACGPGNNGGDGFVCARYLAKSVPSAKVSVVLLGDLKTIRSDIARHNFKRVPKGVKKHFVKDVSDVKALGPLFKKADLVVDAILGSGAKGWLAEPIPSMLLLINGAGKPIVAVDVPTGLGTPLQLHAQLTVTFVDVKEEMSGQDCGNVVVVDIGIPQEALRQTGPGELLYYNFPTPETKKGARGRILVVGGGPYTGAPYLSAKAALRSGVDLVYILTPKAASDTIASYSPNVIVRPLDTRTGSDHIGPGHLAQVLEEVSKADVVVLGPGMGDHPDSIEASAIIIGQVQRPMVIDADALKAIKEGTRLPAQCILTPHRGEFANLMAALGLKPTGEDKEGWARDVASLAKAVGATIVRKGPMDIISDGEHTKFNETGNPAMAVGGTGDVLAGLCAGFLANIKHPFRAACLGAFLNGYFGDRAYGRKGCSLVATDLLDEIAIRPQLAQTILDSKQ